MKITTTILLLFVITMISLAGFQTRIVPITTMQYVVFAVSVVIVAMGIPYFFTKSIGFVLPVQLICISMAVSMFMAYVSWDQSFFISLKGTLSGMHWMLFFYLYKKKISIKIIEDIVLVYGVIYIVLFLFQFTHSGTVYFGWQEEFVEDRGVVRVNFPGTGIFFLSNFIALNRFTTVNKNKILWGGYVLGGFATMILQVTRQYVVFLLLIYLFHFMRGINVVKRAVVLVVFSIVVYFAIVSDNPISKGLIEVQKETASEKGDYIRIRAGEYFLTEFSPSTINRIFGNGASFGDQSNRAKAEINLQSYGYYLSDVGIIAIYVMFGVLAVLAFIMIFIKSFTFKIPGGYQYLKYYIWMLLFTCFTSDSLYGDKFLIANVFAVYCFQIVYEQSLIRSDTNYEEFESMDMQKESYN